MDKRDRERLWREFGARLRGLRTARSLRMDELARLSHLTYNSIIRYETQGRLPRIDNAVAIAAALGVTVEELVGIQHAESS